MAIEASIERCDPANPDNPVTLTYHHIGAIQVHYPEQELQVGVWSYRDRAAREANEQPVELFTTPLRLSLASWGGEVPSRAEVYEYVHAMCPEFAQGDLT